MYGLTFASYNLILGGLFTFVCDWYTLVAIVDQMLQSVHNGATKSDRNNGYLAYADTGSVTVRSKTGNIINTTLAEASGETKDKSTSKKNGSGKSNDAAPTPVTTSSLPMTFNERTAERLKRWASWWHVHRVVATRVVLLVGWPTVCVAYLVNYFKIMRVLSGDPEAGVTVGESLWSRESNTEFARSKHRRNQSIATTGPTILIILPSFYSNALFAMNHVVVLVLPVLLSMVSPLLFPSGCCGGRGFLEPLCCCARLGVSGL